MRGGECVRRVRLVPTCLVLSQTFVTLRATARAVRDGSESADGAHRVHVSVGRGMYVALGLVYDSVRCGGWVGVVDVCKRAHFLCPQLFLLPVTDPAPSGGAARRRNQSIDLLRDSAGSSGGASRILDEGGRAEARVRAGLVFACFLLLLMGGGGRISDAGVVPSCPGDMFGDRPQVAPAQAGVNIGPPRPSHHTLYPRATPSPCVA